MKKMTCLLFGLIVAFVMAGSMSPVLAQSATPAATAVATAAATPAAPTVAVDGMVDAYYSYNFTNAANNMSGAGNNGTYFDNTDGSYSLGLAELKATATQGLASGHLVLAYGQEGNLGIGSAPGIDVEQAYVSYNPGTVTFSAGRFVTWMGNEVIESTGNWNISRSLLFWYTIPLWHQGVSVAWNPDSTFKLAGYATNGWNNSVNLNSAVSTADIQTFGATIGYTPNSVWSFTLNGIEGPISESVASVGSVSSRYVGELIVDYNASSVLSFALDAEAGGADNEGTADFWGADLYAKYALSSDYSLALRLEELKDNGDVYGIYGSSNGGTTGVPYEGREATLTLAHNVTSNFVVSLEGRYDYALSNGTAFAAKMGPFAGGSDDQLTGTLDTAITF